METPSSNNESLKDSCHSFNNDTLVENSLDIIDSDFFDTRNAIRNSIRHNVYDFSAETAHFNGVLDQQSIKLLKYEVLNLSTKRIITCIPTIVKAETKSLKADLNAKKNKKNKKKTKRTQRKSIHFSSVRNY